MKQINFFEYRPCSPGGRKKLFGANLLALFCEMARFINGEFFCGEQKWHSLQVRGTQNGVVKSYLHV
jgi:hypothetical protein